MNAANRKGGHEGQKGDMSRSVPASRGTGQDKTLRFVLCPCGCPRSIEYCERKWVCGGVLEFMYERTARLCNAIRDKFLKFIRRSRELTAWVI